MNSLSVGPYEVYLFVDGVYPTPSDDLTHADGEAARAAAIAPFGKPIFDANVNCFGLHGPDGLVLIDAGAGEHWGPAYGKASAAMTDAGFTAAQVETVLLTHVHGDHALGLLDGDAARYPNATVRIPRGDLDWYGNPGNLASTPDNKRGGFAIVERLRRAYGVQLGVVDPGPVLPGVDAIALPGHTPGHTGYLIHDGRRALFLCGDVVHVEELQLADPLVGCVYDIDSERALHSRQIALGDAAREGWYIGGGHITGIRRIERKGNEFAFAQENHA